MRSFIREKKIYCGKQYREVDIFSYTDTQYRAAQRGTRSKKIKESEPKQKNLNDKNARRYFIQTAILNFGDDPDALHVTATYSTKYLPATIEEAEREVTNYLRRIQYQRKKEGLPPLKYMLVTAYTTKKNSEKPVRIHHHIIMNGGLDRDAVEELWRKRKRKGQKKGDRIGYCNADRLQSSDDGIDGTGADGQRGRGGGSLSRRRGTLPYVPGGRVYRACAGGNGSRVLSSDILQSPKRLDCPGGP